MLAPGPLLSPVLIGRDDLVALATRRLEEVAGGHGQLLLISGEAGIGKTRLMTEIERLAAGHHFRTARAGLAPQDHNVPTAAILDLARTMERISAFGSAGGDLLVMAGSGVSATGPGRRVLVGRVVDSMLRVVDQRTVLVFEDLQWADELTLEILAGLARRTRDAPLLLLGSYRSDEVARDSALRGWRARLVTQRIAEDLRLARLTRSETALMTSWIMGTGLPAPRDVVDAVYQRTDGVPLHVEELLGAVGRGSMDGWAINAAVPETMEDATLQRVARLSPKAQAVARAGAVIGRRFVPSVLAGIMDVPVDTLDEPLQELLDHDVLDGPGIRGLYDYRHQLLRDALYRSVPAADRRRFHARAAEFGSRLEGASEIHASLHFERAGMRDEAFRTALAGARAAFRLSSYSEAFELYQRAVENMPGSVPGGEQASIILEYEAAAAMTDRVQLSFDLAARARETALEAGDLLVAAAALRWMALSSRRDGRPIAERRNLARQALVELERLAVDAKRESIRIGALSELGETEIDDHDLDLARDYLLEARAIADEHGLRADGMDIAAIMARIDVIEGRFEHGIAAIRSIADVARAENLEEVAVSGFRDASQMAIRALDFREAAAHLGEGLRYAESREQSHCGHIMASASAVVAWAEGRWTDAVERGQQALVDQGSERARAIARLALGSAAMGRGDRASALHHLDAAADFARRGGLLEILLPALWGIAEAALVDGDPETATRLCQEALSLARAAGDGGLLGPFAVTGVRALQAAGRPDRAAAYLAELLRAVGAAADVVAPGIDHAGGLIRLAEGSVVAAREALEAAVGGWDDRGRSWEASWARLDLASALLRSSRYAEAMELVRTVRTAAEAMGSEPLLGRADQLTRLARGRGADLEPWHPLSVRELEVAQCIVAGMTNAEIAGSLGIAPRTASAHVEHILSKLGLSNRAEIAAWTANLQLPTAAASPAVGTRLGGTFPVSR